MMEVMRIDDHAFVNEKGKIINPVNARESALQNEIKSNLPEHIRDTVTIICKQNGKSSSLL